jgi:flagellar biosynthesis GTPase FlhF
MITVTEAIKRVCANFEEVSYDRAIALFTADELSGKVKAVKKEKKVVDPSKPKRPANAYILYSQSIRDMLTEEMKVSCDASGEIFKASLVVKEASRRWKSMTEEEKKPFTMEYARQKAIYDSEMEKVSVKSGASKTSTSSSKRGRPPLSEEKKAAKEAEKEAKKAEKESKKAAKKAEMAAKKAAKKAEMEAKKAAKKEEMEAKKAAKKAEMEAKKAEIEAAETLSVSSSGVESNVSESSAEGIECFQIEVDGVDYAYDNDNNLYTTDGERVGTYDPVNKTINLDEEEIEFPDDDEE